MSTLEKRVLAGVAFCVGWIVVWSVGLALCFGAIGVLVTVARWMAAVLRGGCL